MGSREIDEELLSLLEGLISKGNRDLISPEEFLALLDKSPLEQKEELEALKNASLLKNFFKNNPTLQKYRNKKLKGSFLSILEEIFQEHPDRDFILKHAERYEKKFLSDEKRSLSLLHDAKRMAKTHPDVAFLMLKGALKHSRIGGMSSILILKTMRELLRFSKPYAWKNVTFEKR